MKTTSRDAGHRRAILRQLRSEGSCSVWRGVGAGDDPKKMLPIGISSNARAGSVRSKSCGNQCSRSVIPGLVTACVLRRIARGAGRPRRFATAASSGGTEVPAQHIPNALPRQRPSPCKSAAASQTAVAGSLSPLPAQRSGLRARPELPVRGRRSPSATPCLSRTNVGL